MQKHVFILAAGDRLRWVNPYPKQLAMVGNETCLARLIRQVQQRDSIPYVVTHDLMLFNAAEELGAKIVYPNMHRFTCETLLSTAGLWQPPMAVLVGDGVFTKKAMDTIMNCDAPLRFFGNTNELMGITFDGMHMKRVAMFLTEVLNQREKPVKKQRNPAKLWNLYRVMSGYPINQHIVKNLEQGGLLHHITDCSFDFDTVDKYESQSKIWATKLDDMLEAVHAD